MQSSDFHSIFFEHYLEKRRSLKPWPPIGSLDLSLTRSQKNNTWHSIWGNYNKKVDRDTLFVKKKNKKRKLFEYSILTH